VVDDDLTRGREAAQRRQWATAFEALVAADKRQPLAADDLDLLGTASALCGRIDEALQALQRAHSLHVDAGEMLKAAKSAFWITFHLGNRGEMAQAGGWVARLSRALQDEPAESAAHAYVLAPTAFYEVTSGQYDKGRSTSDQAIQIARRHRDPDVLALALTLQGRALLRQGQVPEGLASLDEAMVGVLADQVSPVVAGTVYCTVIDGCQEIAELRRMSEWTTALTSWCDKQSEMVTFAGQCLVHRAKFCSFTDSGERQLSKPRGRASGSLWPLNRTRSAPHTTSKERCNACEGTSRLQRRPTGGPPKRATIPNQDLPYFDWRRARPTPRSRRSAACWLKRPRTCCVPGCLQPRLRSCSLPAI
jgi:hypothetical protein